MHGLVPARARLGRVRRVPLEGRVLAARDAAGEGLEHGPGLQGRGLDDDRHRELQDDRNHKDLYHIGPPGLPEPGMSEEERALLLELSREQKMQRDLILAMTLMSMKQDPPFLVKKVIRLLRTAGWRVINKHWHEAINFCIQQGSVRASLRDNGLAFEVFWPK